MCACVWEFSERNAREIAEEDGAETGSRTERTARACPKRTERYRSEPKRPARVPCDIQWLQYRAAAGQGSMWLSRGGDSSPVRFYVRYATRVIDESKSKRERAVIIARSIDRSRERVSRVPIDDPGSYDPRYIFFFAGI